MKRSKKWFNVGLMVALCGGLYAFQLMRLAPVTITLEEAIAKKMVSCKMTSTGSYSGESVALSVTNLTNTPLNLTIPGGTVFQPDETGDQDLIVVKQQLMVLNGKATGKQILDGFCMEAHDSAPTADNGMKMTKTTRQQLNDLAAFMNGKGYDTYTTQSAVWVVSDNHPISDVDLDSPQGKALRAFLSKLVNKPDPWYETKQERVVREDRMIECNPVAVNGQITFESTGKTKIHEVVKNAAGTVMNTSTEMEFPKAGKWNYEFTLTVKGWNKGDYVVHVMNGTKVIQSFPFTI